MTVNSLQSLGTEARQGGRENQTGKRSVSCKALCSSKLSPSSGTWHWLAVSLCKPGQAEGPGAGPGGGPTHQAHEASHSLAL